MSKLVPIMGALGSLPFVCAFGKVLTYHDVSRDLSVRWAQHDVIGQKPVLEYVGDDLARVSLSIRFDSNLGVPPLIGLNHLQRMLENKEVKTLVLGGEYLGRFVIESVSEDRRFHSGAGICIIAEATVNLIEWHGKRTNSWSEQMAKLSKRMKGLFT